MTLEPFLIARGVRSKKQAAELRREYHLEMNRRAMMALARYAAWMHEHGVEYPSAD